MKKVIGLLMVCMIVFASCSKEETSKDNESSIDLELKRFLAAKEVEINYLIENHSYTDAEVDSITKSNFKLKDDLVSKSGVRNVCWGSVTESGTNYFGEASLIQTEIIEDGDGCYKYRTWSLTSGGAATTGCYSWFSMWLTGWCNGL